MSGRLEPEPMPRRDFVGLAGLWAAGLAVFSSLLGMARLAKPSVLPEPGARFRIGHPDEYPPGTARTIPEHRVRIVSTPDGVAAQSLVCTHLGCIVKETESGFDCPCHGSHFGPNGEVIAGPAPRALRWFAISRAADGSLVVDAQKEVSPKTFYQV